MRHNGVQSKFIWSHDLKGHMATRVANYIFPFFLNNDLFFYLSFIAVFRNVGNLNVDHFCKTNTPNTPNTPEHT